MADLPSETGDPSADRTHGIMEWPRIPGYEIEGRVGAGGMAVVFRAYDERLRRPVALKVITPALAARVRRRFSGSGASLPWSKIAHLREPFAAESDGLLFIAMRFVAGGHGGLGHGLRHGPAGDFAALGQGARARIAARRVTAPGGTWADPPRTVSSTVIFLPRGP